MTGPKKMLSTKRQHDGVSTAGKANIVSVTCAISKKNKTNNTLINDGNNDNNNTKTIEFASHIIVQFLSTPSLILFSSCNKACMVAVKTEVLNRKKKIAQMNSRVKVLLGLINNNGSDSAEFDILTRANIVEAARLCKEAKRIIDTDLNWHNRIINEEWMSEEFDASRDKYFWKERELLESYRDLRMLPESFYFPPDGSEPLQQLNEELVKSAQSVVGSIGDAGDHIQNITNLYSDHPLYYSDPFFKFRAPCVAQFFSDIVNSTAQEFTSSSSLLEALRFAAREFVYSHRHSRDFIHYLIHCTDEMRKEILKKENKE